MHHKRCTESLINIHKKSSYSVVVSPMHSLLIDRDWTEVYNADPQPHEARGKRPGVEDKKQRDNGFFITAISSKREGVGPDLI
jgi:hypothetical protein